VDARQGCQLLVAQRRVVVQVDRDDAQQGVGSPNSRSACRISGTAAGASSKERPPTCAYRLNAQQEGHVTRRFKIRIGPRRIGLLTAIVVVLVCGG
jgi:hypothetical protein